MTFSHSIASITQVLKDAGEFLRDTAIVNIIDMDCKKLNVHVALYSLFLLAICFQYWCIQPLYFWDFISLHVYTVLEINFEEPDYSITEGDPWPPTIGLQFGRTQNPFTMSLFSVSIMEAIDPAGFNGSDFIPHDNINEATGRAVKEHP